MFYFMLVKSIKKHQKALGSRKGRKNIKKHRKSIEGVLLSTFKPELKGGKTISEKGEISDSSSGHYYSRLSDLVIIISYDVVSRFYSQSVRSLLGGSSRGLESPEKIWKNLGTIWEYLGKSGKRIW